MRHERVEVWYSLVQLWIQSKSAVGVGGGSDRIQEAEMWWFLNRLHRIAPDLTT